MCVEDQVEYSMGVVSFLSGPWRPLLDLSFASGESCTTKNAKNNCVPVLVFCCFTNESLGEKTLENKLLMVAL